MKRLILLILLLGSQVSTKAQLFCNPCKDSTKQENIFYTCYQDYNPVCGCDGKTYRNDCFAINKYAFYPCGYYSGICGNFDMDISPNFISSSEEQDLNIQVYNRTTGYLNINIFNAYGRIQFQGTYPLPKNAPDGYLSGPSNQISNISTLTWEKGLYIVEAIFEGERKIIKLVKATNFY